jgi:hypothetical protein
MDEKFRQYHQFSDAEFKKLWEECVFVFDTNTLLNMYRYSRKTVAAYIDVLTELKDKGQLWIPYQVGYEFYENRIGVIREYEKSYSEILNLIEKAKNDIETRYKNHPFLDLEEIKGEMTGGLLATEQKIKDAQAKHPKWLKNDDVLSKLSEVFQDCIGEAYGPTELDEIKTEGIKRYDAKIPPGFKDSKKSDDRRFGDLVLWFQIIDHAKEIHKPIVFISGDVKEDWWLLNDGERIMPLPQLKKELLDKAQVEFHIYTADKFLELYQSGEKVSSDHTDAVEEVRKIRLLEETRRQAKRIESLDFNSENETDLLGKHYIIHIYAFELVQRIMDILKATELDTPEVRQLGYLYRRLRQLRNSAAHGYYEEDAKFKVFSLIDEIRYILQRMLDGEPDKLSRNDYAGLAQLVRKLELFLSDSKNSSAGL